MSTEASMNEQEMIPRQRILASLPLGRKILLFLFCAFLPAMAMAVVLGLNERQDKIKEAERHALLLVQSLAAQQEQIATATRQMLSTLAELPQVQRLETQACNELFAELLRKNPQYSTIAMATPDGMMVAASQPFQPGSVNLADRRHIREAVRTLDFSAGEYIVGRVTKTQSMNFTYPVLDADRNLTAIVVAGLKLDVYTRFVAQANLPSDCAIAILDHQGVRLFRWPEHATSMPGTQVSNDVLEHLDGSADQGAFKNVGADKVPRIYAFKRLSLRAEAPPYLHMLVGLSENSVLRQANVHMARYFMILGCAAVINAALAWLMINVSLVKPINGLAVAVRSLGKGRLSTRTGLPHTADELGQLARSFDEMAALLETKEKERDDAEQALSEVNAELEHRVRERTAELADANATLTAQITLGKESEDRIRRLNRIHAMMSGTNEAIAHLRAPEALFMEICRIAVEVGGFSMAWIGKVADDGKVLPVAQAGESNGYVEGLNISLSCEGPTSRALRTGRPQFSNDIAEDPLMRPWRDAALARGYRSSAAFPIILSGHPRATFNVYAPVPDVFDDQELELLDRLAGNLSFALELAAAEAKAREEQNFRQTLMESVAGLFYAVDTDGRLLHWNKHAEEVTGRSAAELSNMPILDHIDPDDRAQTMARIEQAFREGEASVEARVVARDGTRAPYLFRGRRLFVAGRPILVGTGIDISERAQAARELERYRLHLEELVASRTAELEAARTAAEAASQAKSSFLANMSHEIRTPMNAVIGFAHLMKNEPLSPRQIDQLDKLSNAARHLLQIINDILDISKIEAHKMRLEAEDFEPARVVDHVCAIVADKVAEKGLNLLVDLSRAPSVLRGDGLRFGQILLNLVSNAVKFTEKGSITLVGRIVGEESRGVTLRFEVRDTGIGMTDEQLGRLFEAFEQADGSTTRRFGGTGLGLAISKRLIELMNGRMGVESEVGRGTFFWLEVPFEKPRAMPEAPRCFTTFKGMRALVIDDLEDSRETPVCESHGLTGEVDRELARRRGAHILLAEDNAINLEVARRLLESIGMRVSAAGNGQMAVESARKTAFDLIFMDVQMPVMDGLRATEAIRDLPGGELVPIVAMTANAFGEDRDRCLQAGMNDHIPKPVAPEKLHEVLIKWLPVREPTAPAPGEVPVPIETEPPQPDALDMLARLRTIDGLDVSAGLKLLGDDVACYVRLLEQFAETHDNDAETLRRLAESGEIEAAGDRAHALKGVAGTLGARRIHLLAMDLEQAAKRKADPHELRSLAEALAVELPDLLKALRKALSDAAHTEKTEAVDWRQVSETLAGLEALLADDDASVGDSFERSKPLLIRALGDDARQLGKQIRNFDYDEALKTLRTARETARHTEKAP